MAPHSRIVSGLLLVAALAACDGSGGGGGSGPVEKRVFLSSMTFTGDLEGIDGADAACQVLADDAGLGGTWMAWLSTAGSSPDLDFTHNDGPYVLVDGTRIADDWDDLTDGMLQNPIELDEYGDPGPLSDRICSGLDTWVWTGTRESGVAGGADDCSGWTSELGGSTWGRSDATEIWSFACSGGANRDRCGNRAPIFCFEQ
jgi:hypothetical protein